MTNKLLTKKLLQRFKEVGKQDHKEDPLVIAKFFNPNGIATWYAVQYDPENKIFFGYVSLFGDWNDEWGCFSLEELQNYRGNLRINIEGELLIIPNYIRIERDLYFTEKKFSELNLKRV